MHRPKPLAPQPSQESVWDYPRPPRLERSSRLVVVRLGTVEIASSTESWRILETSHPPVYYLPSDAIPSHFLQAAPGSSYCEWKGQAMYWSVTTAQHQVERAGWSYPAPTAGFAAIAGFIAFYPGRVECYLDGERVRPQAGTFYGGWVTDEIVGPFKGEPGTGRW